MARRTIRRQPFTVDTSIDTNSGFFTQVEFGGMCDSRNDAVVDVNTFSDVKNLCIDDKGSLVSRAAFKKTNDAYIVNEWRFGQYVIRISRYTINEDDAWEPEIVNEKGYEGMYFDYIIDCPSHDTIENDNGWFSYFSCRVAVDEVGYKYEPKIKCVQIEDKIFVWFDGRLFVSLNTRGFVEDGVKYLYWENADKYLYAPIGKLVINGIETELESPNFLTSSYRKRHQKFALSSLNLNTLVGKDVDVSLSGPLTQNNTEHLYSTSVNDAHNDMFIYPKTLIDSYVLDVVEVENATVIMRYDIVNHTIEVTLDGEYFMMLPRIANNILGNPILTKDGKAVIAFTQNNIAVCRLVAETTEDFTMQTDVLQWSYQPYLASSIIDGYSQSLSVVDPSFTPRGYFETVYQFAYIVKSEGSTYLYAEWLTGSEELWGCEDVTEMEQTDDLKLHFRYVTPTQNKPDVGPAITVLNGGSMSVHTYFFGIDRSQVGRVLRNGDRFFLDNGASESIMYVYKMSADGKNVIEDHAEIIDGDVVLLTDFPLDVSITSDYDRSRKYKAGDIVTGEDRYLYECVRDNYNHDLSQTGYWNKTNSRSYTQDPLLIGQFIRERTLRETYYCQRDRRFIVRMGGIASTNTPIVFEPYVLDVSYTAQERADLFNNSSLDWTVTRVADNVSTTIQLPDLVVPATLVSHSGFIVLPRTENPGFVSNWGYRDLRDYEFLIDGVRYRVDRFAADTAYMDVNLSYATLYGDESLFISMLACGLSCIGAEGQRKNLDCIFTYSYLQDVDSSIITTDLSMEFFLYDSHSFRIGENGQNVVTDKYLYANGVISFWPDNGKLSHFIEERSLRNDDNLVVSVDDRTDNMFYTGNIHKVRIENGSPTLALGTLKSGDTVAYVEYAFNEKDYLTPDDITPGGGINLGKSNIYFIEKIAAENGEWSVLEGEIRDGDLIRLRSYNESLSVDVGHPANPTDTKLELSSRQYLSRPEGWTEGDDWPSDWSVHPPLIPLKDGSVRLWEPGDTLPTGSIEMYGAVNIGRRITAVNTNNYGTSILVDGVLWTNRSDGDNIVEVDEFIQGKSTSLVPEHHTTLDAQYFSFENELGQHLLQISDARRDDDNYLLYLPKKNEFVFTDAITNLHNLSDSAIVVFTQQDIWYINRLVSNDTIVYTRPIKSKIPVGCREGCDVITVPNGNALIFATSRGIVAMAPENFVATAEPILSYLSDSIQRKYNHFYNDTVRAIKFVPNEFEVGYTPMIKIVTYKTWIMFYQYMGKEVLLLDLRNNSWWIWDTPYPIKNMHATDKLTVLMQIDFSLYNTQLCVPFILDEDAEEYVDDIVKSLSGKEALNGDTELVFENEFFGNRRVYKYASPVIDWYFDSQKLHFGAMNNYKCIKAVHLNLVGDETTKMKLSMKAYRNVYHPEQSTVVEVKINEVRTFIKRMNVMHVINFQYTLENDDNVQNPRPLELNSTAIKYEVKERIR